MAELLYKIADIINANSKVYRAVVPEARHDYMMHENGKLVKSSCLVLRIMLSGKVKYHISAQGGLSVAGRCRCLTKDSNTSIEKEGYIPYSLQA